MGSFLDDLEAIRIYREPDFRVVETLPSKGFMADFDITECCYFILEFDNPFDEKDFLADIDSSLWLWNASGVVMKKNDSYDSFGNYRGDRNIYVVMVNAYYPRHNYWFYTYFIKCLHNKSCLRNRLPLLSVVDDDIRIINGYADVRFNARARKLESLGTTWFFGEYDCMHDEIWSQIQKMRLDVLDDLEELRLAGMAEIPRNDDSSNGVVTFSDGNAGCDE